MRIVCVGGGPAGLYFALLMKLAEPSHEVVVFERRPKGHTGGWGVTLWDDLLADLKSSDEVTAQRIEQSAVRWCRLAVDREGDRVEYEGDCYAIGRTTILQILAERATTLGVDIRFGVDGTKTDDLDRADVVVASDGVFSALRQADRFGTRIIPGRTKFVWLGTSEIFKTFTFAFVRSAAGWIWAYAYAFDERTSTFIVECTEDTWRGLGFDSAPGHESLRTLERLFARQLEGRHLLESRDRDSLSLPWQTFPTVTNERWHSGNVVLIGDAAHTTHFSIGSGMRLGLQDAICLARQLQAQSDVAGALERYQEDRQRALVGPQTEAQFSQRWFENFERYAALPTPALSALLRARRDPLMTKIPPHVYYRLDAVVNSSDFTRSLRHRIGPTVRTFYGKYARRG